MIRKRILLLAAVVVLGGCGYGLVGRTSSLPEDIEDVYVEPLGNRTTRSQVDLLLTQAIGDEFVKRRRFNLISDIRGSNYEPPSIGAYAAPGSSPGWSVRGPMVRLGRNCSGVASRSLQTVPVRR